MQKKDPTEDVMAAIARIVENPSLRMQAGKADAADPVVPTAGTQDDDEPVSGGAHGYSRLGPGPLPALRFRWTARRDAAGDHYVDETIGEYSRPVSTGPMTAEEAVAFVDKQVRDARERFDRLKADMSVPGPAPETDAEPGA